MNNDARMWTFIDCAVRSAVAFNRNHPLLLNNNLRNNINRKLQLNINRNNLKKNTDKKIQAGWCIEDFIGNFANTTTTAETTTTRSSSPLTLLSCFNQLTSMSSLSSVLASYSPTNINSNSSSSDDHYPSPSSASSAKKTNLFYHHRKAFRRKEDTGDHPEQSIVANITIGIAAITTVAEYLLLSIISNALLLTLTTIITTTTTSSLVGSTNFATIWS